jgi:hypothetical protein
MKIPPRDLVENMQDDDSFESPAWHAEALAETEARVKAGNAHFVDFADAKEQLAYRHK